MEQGKCAYCGAPTEMKSRKHLGHKKYCSKDCNNAMLKRERTGRKQSDETIAKRIANTDQSKKEKARKLSLITKYGVDNAILVPGAKEKSSKKNRGRKRPRSDEHQRKIIESKRRNGTLSHNETTKHKIAESLKALYQTDDAPVTITKTMTGRHSYGYCNGLYYRSSYEHLFLKYCETNDIKVESAENKEYRVPYWIGDKRHFYYPDFYLPEYNAVIEVKAGGMLSDTTNIIKFDAAAKVYENYIIVDEEVLLDLDNLLEGIDKISEM